jgi:hypothetical protein
MLEALVIVLPLNLFSKFDLTTIEFYFAHLNSREKIVTAKEEAVLEQI